jgi:hypothetical protein
MADFQSLLQEQKQQQDKEQVAISEAAQTYSLQIQKELGLGQSYIKKEGISNAAVSVVQNFQQDLDLIADADFTGFKDIVEKYKALLGEVEGSRRFDNKEKKYIADIVAPVLGEIYPLANAFTAARFGLRDFIKQFKPIKLAARVFGGVPILGSAIQKKIERQEAGEQELRRAERRRAQDIAKESRREIEEQIDGTAPVSPAEAIMEEPMIEDKPIVSKRTELAPQAQVAQSKASKEEATEEQRAVEEDRYEEQKGLFEMIAESTYESKELLQKLVDAEEGIGDELATGAAAIGGTAAGAVGGAAATKALTKKTKPGGIVDKAKSAVKKNVSKAGSLAKSGARVAGKVFLPLAAALAIFDTASAASQADEILGKKEEDLTLRDKTSAGIGGLLEGISFGLIKKDKVAKFLAGSSDDAGVDTSLVPNKSEAVQAAAEVGGNVKDMVNIDSKRTIVRTQLETSGMENMMEKLIEKMPPSNNVVNTNQQINSASTNNVLPDLSNKNVDETVNALKNVY